MSPVLISPDVMWLREVAENNRAVLIAPSPLLEGAAFFLYERYVAPLAWLFLFFSRQSLVLRQIGLVRSSRTVIRFCAFLFSFLGL
jgi:hypothetical protein